MIKYLSPFIAIVAVILSLIAAYQVMKIPENE